MSPRSVSFRPSAKKRDGVCFSLSGVLREGLWQETRCRVTSRAKREESRSRQRGDHEQRTGDLEEPRELTEVGGLSDWASLLALLCPW